MGLGALRRERPRCGSGNCSVVSLEQDEAADLVNGHDDAQNLVTRTTQGCTGGSLGRRQRAADLTRGIRRGGVGDGRIGPVRVEEAGARPHPRVLVEAGEIRDERDAVTDSGDGTLQVGSGRERARATKACRVW